MIYIASKCKHGPRWQGLRASGIPIISTWIDESKDGDTSDWPDLWSRCIREAASCDALIVVCEPGETLKGAWVEVGAALAHNHPVIGVGCESFTVSHHELFSCVEKLGNALTMALEVVATRNRFRDGIHEP